MPWWSWWSSNARSEDSQPRSSAEHIDKAAQDLVSVTKQRLHNVGTDKPLSEPTFLHTFKEPSTIAATIVLTTVCLGCFGIYSTYLRRIPEATNIPSAYFRKRSLFGKVISVGDGDNFRIFHTPGGRFAGWGWLPWRGIPSDRKLLKNKTVHVRLAGIDAPELSHFGRPAQPYSKEALEWLTSYISGRRVRAYVYKIDQYSRVVATAYVWRGIIRRDVGLQMLRAGFATVYEAKSGAEFGKNLEPKYRSAEQWAKLKKRGIWGGDMKGFESPREYKRRHTGGDAG